MKEKSIVLRTEKKRNRKVTRFLGKVTALIMGTAVTISSLGITANANAYNGETGSARKESSDDIITNAGESVYNGEEGGKAGNLGNVEKATSKDLNCDGVIGTAERERVESEELGDVEKASNTDLNGDGVTGKTQSNTINASDGQVPSAGESEPKPFIIDTDFSSDVDDALAISVAMYFQDQGMMDLRGVALCCTSHRGAMAMNALLAAHKYWDIPVAADWDDGIPIGSPYHLGMESYPHKEDYYSDTVTFYRKLLAESPNKVNIVTLGQTINLSRLLDSQPDAYSPLTGYELVAQKVEKLYILGCKANGQPENNMFYAGENIPENKYYGTQAMGEAGSKIAKTWPTKIMFITAEIGGVFEVGQIFQEVDKAGYDILSKALIDFGQPWGRFAFDPTAIYVACYDANGYIDNDTTLEGKSTLTGIIKKDGNMSIYANGSSNFTYIDDGTARHEVVEKIYGDWYYRDEINKMLRFEYDKRHPEQN